MEEFFIITKEKNYYSYLRKKYIFTSIFLRCATKSIAFYELILLKMAIHSYYTLKNSVHQN